MRPVVLLCASVLGPKHRLRFAYEPVVCLSRTGLPVGLRMPETFPLPLEVVG